YDGKILSIGEDAMKNLPCAIDIQIERTVFAIPDENLVDPFLTGRSSGIGRGIARYVARIDCFRLAARSYRQEKTGQNPKQGKREYSGANGERFFHGSRRGF